MSLTGACTTGEVRSSWPGSCRRACGRDGDQDSRPRRQIASSILVKSVSRRSDRTRDHKPVQSLAFGSRQARHRDRTCLSLYERIPAGSAKDYDRQFIAQTRSFVTINLIGCSASRQAAHVGEPACRATHMFDEAEATMQSGRLELETRQSPAAMITARKPTVGSRCAGHQRALAVVA